jgi:CNT family concentrative nucleoside transporter
MGNFIGLAGIAVILGIAVLFSSNRKAIQLRIVGAAFALQVLIATLVLYWDRGRQGIEIASKGIMAVINYSKAVSVSRSTSCRSLSSFPP